MWKKAIFTVVCMVLGVGGLAQAQGQTRTAAMIVNPDTLSAGFDQAMHDRLAATGYDVTVVVSDDVGGSFTIDDADTYDLLLVSESIGSSSADPLIGTTTPTMHNESYGWDNWFLTTGANMHWVSGDSVDIVNDAHPIAAMAGIRVGPMAFFSNSASWTTDSVSALAPGAELIAQINEAGTDVAIIFAVEEGAELANGSAAPTRIAGFSIPGNNAYDATVMTDDAWALFDATVRWLTRSVLPTVAKAPSPVDTSIDVPRDVLLSWEPGESADTHDVYLGTDFDDVNDASRADPRGVLVSSGHDANSYDPGLLEYGTTYYWRIDEVNAPPDSTIFKGPVWSFDTEPYTYPIANVTATSNGEPQAGTDPQSTANGAGLNENDEHSTEAMDMWLGAPAGDEPLYIQYEFDRVYKLHEMQVWNYNVVFEAVLGFGLKDVTVEYSENGTDWTALGDVELAQATATSDYTANTTVDFGDAGAKVVRLTINSNHGVLDQFGLSEVRFMFIPAHAREPQPADGATGVDPNPVLDWRMGRDATSHEVYLSTDEAAVAAGEALVDTITEKRYAPEGLDFGTTYYWRIDEVQETESWVGDTWNFVVQEYAVIDDMESYNDDDNTIFDTWIDGFVNETGSTVGYFNAPFAERGIVNSGSQSMPLEYANDAAPFYSEAERELGNMNLDTNGADSLRLFVAGQADNAPESLYVAVEDTSGNVAVATHPDAGITTGSDWTEWVIPFSDLAGVDLGRVAVMYIGVGDRDNPTAGGTGTIFVDDIGYGSPATE